MIEYDLFQDKVDFTCPPGPLGVLSYSKAEHESTDEEWIKYESIGKAGWAPFLAVFIFGVNQPDSRFATRFFEINQLPSTSPAFNQWLSTHTKQFKQIADSLRKSVRATSEPSVNTLYSTLADVYWATYPPGEGFTLADSRGSLEYFNSPTITAMQMAKEAHCEDLLNRIKRLFLQAGYKFDDSDSFIKIDSYRPYTQRRKADVSLS